VPQAPRNPAALSKSDDLRVRSGLLRERSRDLQVRSQLWRTWTPRAISGAAQAVEPHPGNGAPDAATEMARLLRAERDLERAIADCKRALEEVRRELRWQDPALPPVVH
jgi:hypothetical protein